MMEGDPVVDKLMRPVMDALIRHAIRGASRTDIYNRAYEAVMNSMVVMDTMREQLSKANERAEKAERELAELKKQTRWIPVSERLPEEGQPVLIDFGNNEITVGIWFWEIEPEEWNGTYCVGWQHWDYRWDKFFPSDEPPLHWQPIPKFKDDTNE